MTKVYKLNEQKNNATIIIYGKTGNMVRYTFKDGNTAVNQPATCVLNNEYYQELLENSDYFQKNIVALDPKFKVATPKKATSSLTKVEDVKSVSQAVEFCAEKFGEVVKTAKQAKELAKENGYDLVNLKVKE